MPSGGRSYRSAAAAGAATASRAREVRSARRTVGKETRPAPPRSRPQPISQRFARPAPRLPLTSPTGPLRAARLASMHRAILLPLLLLALVPATAGATTYCVD